MRLSPEAKAGITVILSIILFAAMAVAVGKFDFGNSNNVQLNIMYDHIDGLLEGAPVRYAGVNVGSVKAIQLTTNGVLVNIQFNRDLIIPADSQFVIANSGILGDKYIEIKPGKAQEPLDVNQMIRGVAPVNIDNMLHQVEGALVNLNNIITSITEVTASADLQNTLTETGVLLKDTVASLKTAVDQVTQVTLSFQSVVNDVSVISQQIPELDLQSTFADISKFAQQLASLNLVEPIDEIKQFVAELNSIPIAKLASDVQTITEKLSGLDLGTIESNLQQFTSMLAALDVQPLVDEIMIVTEQIKALELDQRGAEIARFTAKLGDLPITEIADDLRAVANNLAQIPLEAIASEVYALSHQLAAVPIDQIAADLQIVVAELKQFGWQDMAAKLNSFTDQLASVNLEKMLAGVTADLNVFSNTLASLQIDALLESVNKVVMNLDDISSAVDPQSVAAIVADLEGISANVRAATVEINNMVAKLNLDLQDFSSESLLALIEIRDIVEGVEQTVDNINLFIADLTTEGDTAASLKSTLANIEAGTKELAKVLNIITAGLTSGSGPLAELQTTMDTIQKLNQDIEKVKTMGEKVQIKSNWSAYMNLLDKRLMANIDFEFQPYDSNSFILVGMRDILGDQGNHLQLQYGRQAGLLRHRYGIIDTSLGIGLDGQITDQWGLTAELKNLTTKRPTLSLQAEYAWTPDWVIGLSLHDVLNHKGLSVGIERRF